MRPIARPLLAAPGEPALPGPMTPDSAADWPRRRLLLTTTAWAAAAVIYATHLYLYHRLSGVATGFGLELAEASAHFGVWALLTPLALRLARDYELLARPWPRRLSVHLLLALGIALAQLALHTLVDHLLIHRQALEAAALETRLRSYFARTYYANVVVYFALVLSANGLAQLARRRTREAELERHLAQAQLDALRQQLQPHFLFNALNTVAALVEEEPRAAQRMLTRLGDLLRQALDRDSGGEVPLARELELAQSYLAIERVRFADRLQVSIDVDERGQGALVPGLLLQPLLENAVRHGIARKPGPGRIELRVDVVGPRLRLAVLDDGEGLSPHGPAAVGIGLTNVRARLARLYGDDQRFELRARPSGGAEAIVELPFRRASAAAKATP